MSQWNNPAGREGLRAWKMERADLRSAIDQAGEARVGTPGSPAWNPRCHACGEPATAKLVFRWADGSENHRTRVKCHGCLDYALTLWDRLRESAPEATAGLTVLVVAA